MREDLHVAVIGRAPDSAGTLGTTLGALGCGEVVTVGGVEELQHRAVDLALVCGDTATRAAHCRALADPTRAHRPYVVALVEPGGSLERALEDGADDAFEAADLARLRVAARNAALLRRHHPRSTASPEDLLARVSDFVLEVDRLDHITYLNRDPRQAATGEVLGSHVHEYLGPDTRSLYDRARDDAIRTGEPQFYEAKSLGGTYRVRVLPRRVGGEIVGVTLLATDVSEFVDAVERLRASESRATAIVDALPDIVFRVGLDGTYLDVHAPRESEPLLVGLPRELIGRRVRDVLPADVATPLMAAISHAISHGTLEIVTYRLERRGGTQDFEARIVSSGPDQAIAVVRDMTEHNQRREHMALVERMASLGTMAAGVAHELNSPLTFVILGLEWMEQQLSSPTPRLDALRERLHEIDDGARRIQRIVRDLKGFTRSEARDDLAVSVASTIDGALSLAAAEIRYRARVEKEYQAVPPVLGNHARLGQVFLNLLVNAAHALPEDRAGENVIVVRTSVAPCGRVAVEVSDNGVGIPQTRLARLFEPFYTTKGVGEGTGLGLWICHEIVRDLGGTIEVESEVGVGSTFRVLLPPSPAACTPQSSPPQAPAVTPRRGRVLVIDDEPNLARTLARLLDGHDVQIAAGGAPALELLGRDQEFDLVLCDLMMPRVTGMDVYTAAKQRWPALAERFAFMTGGAFTPRARTFLDEVGLPKLEKPFTVERVLSLLEPRLRDAGHAGGSPAGVRSPP